MVLSEAPFRAFSLSHGVAVAVVFFLGLGLFAWVRSRPQSSHKLLRWLLAAVLLGSAFSGVVIPLLRYGVEGWDEVRYFGLPLFLCDVVSIVLAFALVLKSQRLAEFGYVWALAGTVQGLVTPVLAYDWPSLEFICFFAQHGLAPAIAVLLVWGFGLRPEAGAYKRVWIATWMYLVGTMLFNYWTSANYGFLNAKPSQPTAFDYLGDYPWYLLSLHLIAAVVFFLLLLPFRRDSSSGLEHKA